MSLRFPKSIDLIKQGGMNMIVTLIWSHCLYVLSYDTISYKLENICQLEVNIFKKKQG